MENGRVLFPMHLGCGNRGCEAITRGTAKILGLKKENTVLFNLGDSQRETDLKLGMGEIGTLIPYMRRSAPGKISRGFYKGMRILGWNLFGADYYPYCRMIPYLKENDTVLLTGGDLFCYEDQIRLNIRLIQEIRKKAPKAKMILWGASLEKKFLTKETLDALAMLDLITIRESLSFETLKELLPDADIRLFPDPGFVLEAKAIDLPDYFSSGVIGFNLSNYVNGGSMKTDTLFSRAVFKTFDHILTATDRHILLIPHVTWRDQDDRFYCRNLYENYKDNPRVHLLDINALSYCEIRHIIANLELFAGARTHSVISAYSMGVPALALSYSVKSRGIAGDLGLPEETLLSCRNLSGEDDLLNAFLYVKEHAPSLHELLEARMPEIRRKAFEAKNAFEEIVR